MRDDSERGEGGSPLPTFGRRDFLALGSFWAAATCLEGATGEGLARQAGSAPAPQTSGLRAGVMSVGYVEDSAPWAQTGRLPWDRQGLVPLDMGTLRVIPATSLSMGDSELGVTPPRVTVHGLYPGLPNRSLIDTIWFDQVLPYVDPRTRSRLRFAAWTYKSRPAVNVGQVLSFRAQADPWLGFSLAVGTAAPLPKRIIEGASTAPARLRWFETYLISGSDWGRPKLKTGIYLMGLSEGTWGAEAILPQQGERPRTDLISIALSVRPGPGA